MRRLFSYVMLATVCLMSMWGTIARGDRTTGKLVVEQHQDGRVQISNNYYLIEHSPKYGGTIDRITYAQSGKVVGVRMQDGFNGGYRIESDANATMSVDVAPDGQEATVRVSGRYQYRKTSAEACPAVEYTYQYRADSPLVRVRAILPRQEVTQTYTRLMQYAFDFLGEKPFDRIEQLATRGGDGVIMPATFAFNACEDRPKAGVLYRDDVDALGVVNPFLGSFTMDAEAKHIRVRHFMEEWYGRELTTESVLYIGPAAEVDEALENLHGDACTGKKVRDGVASVVPQWRAYFKRQDDGRLVMTSSGDKEAVVVSEGGHTNYHWSDLSVGPSRIDVVMVCRDGDDGMNHWSIDVTPKDEQIGLWTLEFPVVSGIVARDDIDGADYLLFPYKSGARVPNPGASGLWESIYPGQAGWQFLAYWQGDEGLYIGAHDPGVGVKTMRSLPMGDGTLELSMSHSVPGQGTAGNGYAMDYDVVIGPFVGDWFDAVQIYRSWMVEQSWFPKKPLHANEDVPTWLKDVVVSTRRSGLPESVIDTSILRNEAGKAIEYYHGVLDEHADLGAAPTLLSWYDAWWNRELASADKFTNAPTLIRPAGLRKGFERLHEKGIHAVVYLLFGAWDYESPSWQAEDAAQAVVILPNGKPFLQPSRHLGRMCPATTIYQQKMASVVDGLFESADVDGVYLDLGGTRRPLFCFSTKHGHPVGSGSWLTQGKMELLRQMREAGRKRNPEFALIIEGTGDCWLNVSDSYIMFESSLPIRQALYGDYQRTAGGKRSSWDSEPLEALNAAKHFAWGEPIGRLVGREMYSRKLVMYPDRVAYYRGLANHKTVARPWLNYGRMLRPARVSQLSPAGPVELMPDAMIPHATWQAPDGSVAFVFANARHSTEVTFQVEAELAAYEFPGDGSWSLYALDVEATTDGESNPVAQWTHMSTIDGPINRHETLSAGGTMILVAKPTEILLR